MDGRTLRLWGQIAATGTRSGTRVVVGRWATSPLGAFADVMIEDATGVRTLLAPNREVIALVTALYEFERVLEVPVDVEVDPRLRRWYVRADPLAATLRLGAPTAVGRSLGLLPRRVATAPWFARLSDPAARLVTPGVRTHGRAGSADGFYGTVREHYGATNQVALADAHVVLDGVHLGRMAPVHPPVRFGFSSAPRRPSVTTVAVTVVTEPRREPPPDDAPWPDREREDADDQPS